MDTQFHGGVGMGEESKFLFCVTKTQEPHARDIWIFLNQITSPFPPIHEILQTRIILYIDLLVPMSFAIKTIGLVKDFQPRKSSHK